MAKVPKEGRILMGAALRSVRKAKSLNTSEAAELAGISREVLSRIENGRFSTGADHLCAVAEAYGYEWKLTMKEK